MPIPKPISITDARQDGRCSFVTLELTLEEQSSVVYARVQSVIDEGTFTCLTRNRSEIK